MAIQTQDGSRYMLLDPDRLYPFIDRMFPLAQVIMVEAPRELEQLFRQQAAESGIEIARDQLVELRCRSGDYPDATFAIFWPSGDERIHMLVPRTSATGLA